MSRYPRMLGWSLVMVVVFLQVAFWQTTIVVMAHVHSEMNYPTAVSLLEEKPAVFYGLLVVPLLLSDVVLLLWWTLLRGARRQVINTTQN
jgi:hypothetical protein